MAGSRTTKLDTKVENGRSWFYRSHRSFTCL